MQRALRIITLLAASTGLSLGLGSAQTVQPNADADMEDPAGDNVALTCGDLAAMDAEEVPGTLYFLAGYHAGRTLSETGDTGTKSSEEVVQAEAVPPGAAANGDGVGMDPLTPKDSAAFPPDDQQFMDGFGYFQIDIQKVIEDCQENPETAVAQLVKEQGQPVSTGAGASTDD